MNAYALFASGPPILVTGRTVTDLLLAAERVGSRSVRVHLDGGVERYIRLSGEWVVL